MTDRRPVAGGRGRRGSAYLLLALLASAAAIMARSGAAGRGGPPESVRAAAGVSAAPGSVQAAARALAVPGLTTPGITRALTLEVPVATAADRALAQPAVAAEAAAPPPVPGTPAHAGPPHAGGGRSSSANGARRHPADSSGGAPGGRAGSPSHDEIVRLALDMMLCTGEGDAPYLVGGETGYWVERGGLGGDKLQSMMDYIAEEGGFIALCLDGEVAVVRAEAFDEATGRWTVNVRTIDTSRSLASGRLRNFNGGETFWLGRPDGAAEDRTRQVRGDYFRGNPVPGE